MRKEVYEYAFSAVPASNRKATVSILLILAGAAFSTSGLTVGVQIGSAMTVGKAIAVCITGNLLLFLVALFWGMLGYKSGYTSSFLVKKILGDKTAKIFSVFVIMAVILWVGVNGDVLARVILSSFRNWPFPVSMTAMAAVIVVMFCSEKGWKGLEIVSRIGVPLIVVLTICNVSRIGVMKEGFQFLLEFRPKRNLSFLTAIMMIVGNYFLTVVTVPDICRFARSRKAVLGCVSIYSLILTIDNLCGVLIAQATQAHNLNYGVYLLEMVLSSFMWIVLCMYTTQNVNMYIGSLAIQNLVRETVMGGNISHRVAVMFIGGFSGIVALMGATKYLSEVANLSVVVLMPLTGIALVEVFAGQKLKNRSGEEKDGNVVAAWIIGSIIGGIMWYYGRTEMLGLAMVCAAGIYAWMRR